MSVNYEKLFAALIALGLYWVELTRRVDAVFAQVGNQHAREHTANAHPEAYDIIVNILVTVG